MLDILILVLMGMGLFFMVVGTVGLLRFPDLYTRAHAVGKCDSLGESLLLLGVLLYEGLSLDAGKLLFLLILIFALPPTATYAIVHAAYIRDKSPWMRGEGRE